MSARTYSETEVDAIDDAGKRIMRALDDLRDYDVASNLLAAHAQRIICDKAESSEEKFRLLARFSAACYAKIKWHADMATGNVPLSPSERDALVTATAAKILSVY